MSARIARRRLSLSIVAALAIALSGVACRENGTPAPQGTGTATTVSEAAQPVQSSTPAGSSEQVTTQQTQPQVEPSVVKQPVKQATKQPVKPAKQVEPQTAAATETGHTHPEVEAPKPVTLAAGTDLSGALQNVVSTDKSRVGDAVVVRTSAPVVVDGRTVVAEGAVVHGTVTHVRNAGRMHGAAELTVRFTELELPGGERVTITCEPLRRVSKGDGKETAAEIGGAATLGGVIGGIAGGKDDVLKGVAIGAAVGTGVAAATKGDIITLQPGQTVQVRLAAPVTMPESAGR